MLYEVWEQKPRPNKDALIAQRLTWERAFTKKKENNNYYVVPEPIDTNFGESMQ